LILASLAAAGEVTRLRLLVLLAEAELTVTELVTILRQSQPRISRHLKLLVESGLVERNREGAWAFFRLSDHGPSAALARDAVARLDPNDAVLAADRLRLAEVRDERNRAAARYFASQAKDWNRIRALHVPEEQVDRAIGELVGAEPLGSVLDLGTGTGRMLEIIAPHADRAVGIDQSRAMLNVARARLDQAGLRNVQLRQGDLYALPVERDAYDLVVLHQVLHYLDDPSRAIREAARALRPAGRLLIVDFAPHLQEQLRTVHAHRRLGFAAAEVSGYLRDAGLELLQQRDLAPEKEETEKLTVSLWLAKDRRLISDAPIGRARMELA
jgi:demethylmenaquinone methyltransferase/2-methoxy-6-polyprenyl-1,4-benzoquinol methylase/ArsR family transcriptional regulator